MSKRRRGSRAERNTVNVDLSGVEVGGRLVDEGDYRVTINEVEQKDSKAGNPMLNFEFEILDGPFKATKLFDNASLQAHALFNLKAILLAVGWDIPDQEFSLDLTGLIGQTCIVEVTHEVYQGKKRNRISGYHPETDGYDEDEDSDDEYEDWSVDELKDELDHLDISYPRSAKKADLIALLEEDDGDDEGSNYGDWTRKELAAECRDRGIRVLKRYTEEDLIDLLEDDDLE